MERRKTLTMTWDGLGDDDDDERFFETCERLSSAIPLDLVSSSDEDEDFEDSRMSFASAISSRRYRTISIAQNGAATTVTATTTIPQFDYDIWMGDPGSITERRKKLLDGMGLNEKKELLKITSAAIGRAITKKFKDSQNNSCSSSAPTSDNDAPTSGNAAPASADVAPTSLASKEQKTGETERSPVRIVLVRSRSDGDIDSYSMPKLRKQEFFGNMSKQRLTRTSTEIAIPRARVLPYTDGSRVTAKDNVGVGQSNRHGRKLTTVKSNGLGAFFLIKNLDTGKEFIVNEYGEDGTWNRLSDLQTGKKLTMEEFEKTVGHSPVVKELMRRANGGGSHGDGRKLSNSNSYISKSLRMSKRRAASMLKNIKGVASGFIGEREREVPVSAAPQVIERQPTEKQPAEKQAAKNEWVRVRQSGKSHKELSALHLCQEFQAHEGCIWTMKFSPDGHYLASAGEDKLIHVWEVQECEVMSLKPEEGNLTPIHPSLLASQDRSAEAPPLSAEKKKKGKSASRRGNAIPDYVHVPETVFSLSDKPYCSFHGHLEDVLDLSWSKSQLLLSSSMDKTVRLWDLESKTCLKMFAHNDYVTCIQFNPIDDNYFISGSLDAKVRIWSIPERQVVNWTDTHEMVTAISYTPDGLAAFVGTHKGSCRTYSTEDFKLCQTSTIEIRHKKKSHLRKVTGFQFALGNPSEVLVTSADSRIRIVEGSEVVHKFRGFHNQDSQITASFSPDGRFIISASDDSQVFVWKHEEHRNGGTGKGRNIRVTGAHEHFPCKDVSIAIPWPCTIKGDLPPHPQPVHQSKRQSKRSEDNTSAANSKRMLPPLPKKSNLPATENASTSQEEDPAAVSNTESGVGDSLANSKGMLPPLPKKNNKDVTESSPTSPEEDPSAISRTESGIGNSLENSKRILLPVPKKNNNHSTESEPTFPEEDPSAISRTESGIDDSFASSSASIRYGGDSPSISSANPPSSSSASPLVHSSAWGLVIVTASLGGEIRCYQNFGMPRRIGRQGSLFGGPT